MILFIIVVFVAIAFEYINGFHDAANAIATVVSTKVLTPRQAIALAAFFNLTGALMGTAVASTIGKGIVDTKVVDMKTVLCALLGAIIWNLLTWWLALPTSSSHALVSAAAGAAIAKGGFGALILGKKWALLLAFIILSPTIGFLLGTLMMVLMAWVFRRSTPHRVDRMFRRLQLLSAAIYSLGHGGNDAQKTMGIIVLLLSAANLHHWYKPSDNAFFDWFNVLGHEHNVAAWIILICHFAIALGTMFGGWRIVKTMGSGITRLQPVGGFCAETAAAMTIISATRLGIPISTTHAITGSILGVGTTRGIRAVRWIWGQRIVTAWILTIPCSAFMAAVAYFIVHLLVEPLFTK